MYFTEFDTQDEATPYPLPPAPISFHAISPTSFPQEPSKLVPGRNDHTRNEQAHRGASRWIPLSEDNCDSSSAKSARTRQIFRKVTPNHQIIPFVPNLRSLVCRAVCRRIHPSSLGIQSDNLTTVFKRALYCFDNLIRRKIAVSCYFRKGVSLYRNGLLPKKRQEEVTLSARMGKLSLFLFL